jgi:hypothetical protein
MANGCGVVAPRLQEMDQLRECVPMALAQPLSLGEDPVVIAAGEQVGAVQLDCPLQGSALVVLALCRISQCQCVLERGHIELECRGGAPV